MSYLLLTDAKKCPACRRSHLVPTYGQCRHCGMMVFMAQHDFESYQKDTGWREYWVYTKSNGWMHQTQLLMRQEALARDVEMEKLPDNYGTEEFVNQKIDDVKAGAKAAIKERTTKKIRAMKP